MSEYYPDGWVIIELDNKDGKKDHFVFGSWSGGYTQGDSWRTNSGIVRVEENDDNQYEIHGHGKSVYYCHKGSEGRISSYNQAVLAELCESSNTKVINFEDMELKNDRD